jgi:single-strand DNA-binding protein
MVRDPLFRTTQKGTAVCNFTIASNHYFRMDAAWEKETGFFHVETWGKMAEVCSSLGRKGKGVRVVGRLKQERWTGNDGRSHTKVAIIAEHLEYRSDFKKADETVSGHEGTAMTEEQDEFSMAGEIAEEFAAVSF